MSIPRSEEISFFRKNLTDNFFYKIVRFSYAKVVHGIHGFAFDSETKTRLSGVVIHVHGIDHNVTSYHDGDFFRLLPPGVYNLTVERLEYVKVNINVK